jgi:putative transposase
VRSKRFTAPINAEAAEQALTGFEQGPWGQRYPAIGQIWRRAWTEVMLLRSPCPRHGVLARFFAFPDEERRIIYSVTQRRMRGIL